MSDAEENFVAWLRGQGMHDSASLVERLTAERDELRADLEEERQARAYHQKMSVDLFDENVRLRALLREALAHLKTGQWAVPTDITLMSRIDAALKGDGKD